MSFNEGIIIAYKDGLAGAIRSRATTDRERSQAACDLGRRHRRNLIAHYEAYGRWTDDEGRKSQCWEASCACDVC